MRVRVTSSTLVALYTWGAGEIRRWGLSLFPTLSLPSIGCKSSCEEQMRSHCPQWRRWWGLNPGESLMKGKWSSFHLSTLGGEPMLGVRAGGDPYVFSKGWVRRPH